MNRNWTAGWFLRRGKGRLSQEPGAALFQGLRIRLTLWYCAVLGAALVLFSVTLYLGARYFLLTPIEANVALHARAHVGQWLSIAPDRACSSFNPSDRFGPPPSALGQSMFEMVACFDQNGTLLQNRNTAQLPSAFLTNTVAETALREGTATDVVDAGGTVGPIYRYAQVI